VTQGVNRPVARSRHWDARPSLTRVLQAAGERCLAEMCYGEQWELTCRRLKFVRDGKYVPGGLGKNYIVSGVPSERV